MKRNKFITLMLILALTISIADVYIRNPLMVEAATIKISKSKATMEVDSVLTLKLSNLPEGATVTWSTSKKAVATVGKTTGKVTAIAKGTATITATVDSKKYTCKVTVVKSENVPDKLTPGSWIVGEDIPAGKYNLTAESGNGYLIIYKSEDAYDNEDLWQTFEYLGVGSAYSQPALNYTANFKEGQYIEVSGVTLSVTPK